jgi:hypothetical protein
MGYGGVDCVCEQYMFQFSIGDANAVAMVVARYGSSFNSLLEMPRVLVGQGRCAFRIDSVSILYWRCAIIMDEAHHVPARTVSFNSLLEMQTRSTTCAAPPRRLVSILYWRCRKKFNDIPVVVEERFQFSIGDA